MSDSRIDSFTQEAEKVLHFLHVEYSKLQTGRANAALVEYVMVDAYGQKQQLRAVAGISLEGPKTIMIQPWDKSIMNAIEKGLSDVDLGTSPVNDGHVIRINLPPMTEERRTQLKKVVHQLAEEARISIRQQRQAVQDKIKDEEKDEDARFTLQDQLQKSVEQANQKIEESMKKKVEEIMTV